MKMFLKRNSISRHSVVAAVIILILTTLLSVFPASAQGDHTQLKKVKVGYYENEVFQEGASENTVRNGYAYEYYLKLSEYTGWVYEYVYGEFSDLYQKLLDGEIDLIAGLAYKEERKDLIGYPDLPMGRENYNLVKHDTDDSVTAEPKTLNGKKIAVLNSAMVDVLKKYLKDHKVNAEVVIFDDYKDLFASFDQKKTDLYVAEGDGSYGRDHAEIICAFGSSDYYLCVNKKRGDLLEELNTAQLMLDAEEPHYINSLRSKYYSRSVSSRAYSAAEKDWLKTHDTLNVGYLNKFLPMSDTDENGNPNGLVKDIVPIILNRVGALNVRVNYRGFDNYDDMIREMSRGKIDLCFPVGGGLYYYEESGLYPSNAVISAITEIVYKGDYNPNAEHTFSVNKNNKMMYYFVKNNFPDAKITFFDSIEECLNAVNDDKVNYTVLGGLRATDILKNIEYRGLSTRQSNVVEDRCFGVAIGNEGLLKLVNRGLNIIGTEYSQNIEYKYSADLYTYGLVDALSDNIVFVIIILLLIIAMIIFFMAHDSRHKKRQIAVTQSAAAALEEKNAELARSKEALSEALNTAEHANKAKTRFLNSMSHDIRTPMNAIVGFTTMAQRNIDNKSLVRDYLGRITISSRHLLSLINDVLDMSRIESGKMSIEEGDVHLPDLLNDIWTIITSNAKSEKLYLNIDTEIIHEDIVTDRLRLNQVLLNILSNAVKFTHEGGTVSFTVTENHGDGEDRASFEFRISDTGIGMSEEFQEHIFEAFAREQNSEVSEIQGTGLGMAITKNIVDLLGGTITVSSKRGVGSEFTVTIPCKINTDKKRSSDSFNNDPQSPSQNGEAEYNFSGKRLLLVEDNNVNRMIAVSILENAGFEVEIAENGALAVEMVEKSEGGYYDAVLMDIRMPVMNGYEAAKRIRCLEDKKKAEIPIVAVTANAFEEDRKISLEAGMNGHLAKPYDIPEMMKLLDGLLNFSLE